MLFGLQLHADRGADAILDEARQADAQGFDSVWTGDHLLAIRGDPGPDGPLETLEIVGGLNLQADDTRTTCQRHLAEQAEWGVTYVRMTFATAEQQAAFADQVLTREPAAPSPSARSLPRP